MDQLDYQGRSSNELFRYFEKPGSISSDDAEILHSLVDKYPFCHLFHVFQALGADEKTFEIKLSKAALYSPDRKTLFTIIHNPSNLKSFTAPQFSIASNLIDAISILEEPALDVYEESTATIQKTIETNIEDIHSFPLSEQDTPIRSGDEDEFNETAPDKSFKTLESLSETEVVLESVILPEKENLPNENAFTGAVYRSEEDKLILGNIAATSFFAIEGSRLDGRFSENLREISIEPNTNDQQNLIHVEDQVSKYDDDKLPYTFLWWLHKTRKEHAQTYQPYVATNPKKQTPPAKTEDLNHQIIENIFHTQSPAPISESKPQHEEPFARLSVKHREDDIIEKFIKEEPQIKPPSPDKLDMENKARRSAEDPNDLVSETLAIIYTEQMLFNKAIDTYKKLIVKYPEKSTYFADQILKLEKKLN